MTKRNISQFKGDNLPDDMPGTEIDSGALSEGHERYRLLMEIDPDVKGVVSSGYSDDSGMADFKQHGFSGAVAKPYSLEELGGKLSVVLKNE